MTRKPSTHVFTVFLLFSWAVLTMLAICPEAFLQPRSTRQSISTSSPWSPAIQSVTKGSTTTTKTELYNLFGNLFGQQSKEENGNSNDNGNGNSNPVVDVMDIPAKVIKIKPLKFYLQLFLVSQQNTPFQGAWLLNANEEVEEYLEVYFSDGTGMISVQFDDLYGLKIQRKGQRPSLQYMLQESVLLHALLDELEAIAFGSGDDEDDADAIDDSKRLLQFAEGCEDVLSKARGGLPARAA